MAPGATEAPALPPVTIKALLALHAKRTRDMFAGDANKPVPLDELSQRAKIACKLREYRGLEEVKLPEPSTCAAVTSEGTNGVANGTSASAAATPPALAADSKSESRSTTAKLIDSMPEPADSAAVKARQQQQALVLHAGQKAIVTTASGAQQEYMPSAQLARRMASKWPRPDWHAPWKMYRVISGHLGWVRSLAFDPSNEWFCTGSADRTIKIWDVATGQLKLTLTGHIEQVTGLAVSSRHPYMFSCSLDKEVKCWDMEYNKVIRNYHGHLSGIYSIALHPTLDVLMTGGRDAVCRVWDMRTKVQVHCLSGHDDTVCSILSQGVDPQVITGSHDKMIKMWDLRKGKTMGTLTYHKKSVRAMAMHPTQFAFAAASADNIKKYQLPQGTFLNDTLQQQKTIVNCMAINQDNVMVTGGDNGSLWFWDWKSSNNFQAGASAVQPGSLESESGIFAAAFDVTGSRLVTAEADKTIKMWKEDDSATPETHPINFRPPRNIKRY